MLGVTSRALRYYESEGLIESTLTPPSTCRKYSEEQIGEIKKVLALRALGMPVKIIKELARKNSSLRDAVVSLRAELLILMAEKQAQINLLEEVIRDIDKGEPTLKREVICSESQLEIAEICIDAMLGGDYGRMIEYFSEDMRIAMPEKVFDHLMKKAEAPLGAFVGKGVPKRDERFPNVILYPLKHEKMIHCIKFVFHGDEVCGLWTDYLRK